MRALLTPGERPDRVPFIPFAPTSRGATAASRPAPIRRDARAGFLAQVRTQEQFGYDGGPSFALGVIGAWEFGGELRFPGGERCRRRRWPATRWWTRTTSTDCELPDDVLAAGCIPAMLEFSHLQDRTGRSVTVQLGSVFTAAANLVELSTFLRWMMKRPDLAHHLLRLTTDFFVQRRRSLGRAVPRTDHHRVRRRPHRGQRADLAGALQGVRPPLRPGGPREGPRRRHHALPHARVRRAERQPAPRTARSSSAGPAALRA